MTAESISGPNGEAFSIPGSNKIKPTVDRSPRNLVAPDDKATAFFDSITEPATSHYSKMSSANQQTLDGAQVRSLQGGPYPLRAPVIQTEPVTSIPFRPPLNGPVPQPLAPVVTAPPLIRPNLVEPPTLPVHLERTFVEPPVILEPPKIMKNVAVMRAPSPPPVEIIEFRPPPVEIVEVVEVHPLPPPPPPRPIVVEVIEEQPVEIKQVSLPPAETNEISIELPQVHFVAIEQVVATEETPISIPQVHFIAIDQIVPTKEYPIELPQVHFIHIKQEVPTYEVPIDLPQVFYIELDQTETGEFSLPMLRSVNRLEGKTIEHSIDIPIVIYVDVPQDRITVENIVNIPQI